MRKNIILIVVILFLFPIFTVNGLNFRAGLSLGYTPFSLNKDLANTVLTDNSDWLKIVDDPGDTATVSAGSIPRNMLLSLSGDIQLFKKVFVQVDFTYALGMGGARSISDSTANIGGGNRFADREDSYSFISIPVFFGIKNDNLKLGVGFNITSLTYTQKNTEKDGSAVTDLGRSYDREWSGTVIGWNLIIGTEMPLSKTMSLVLDLVYLSAPLEVKRNGLDNLDDTAADIEYMRFPLDGWYFNAGIKIKL